MKHLLRKIFLIELFGSYYFFQIIWLLVCISTSLFSNSVLCFRIILFEPLTLSNFQGPGGIRLRLPAHHFVRTFSISSRWCSCKSFPAWCRTHFALVTWLEQLVSFSRCYIKRLLGFCTGLLGSAQLYYHKLLCLSRGFFNFFKIFSKTYWLG